MAGGTNLDWAFSPAYTSSTEPLRYDDRVATRRCGRPLSPSEIGCCASHFKLWEWLANTDHDQAIIFFEHDVIVDWSVIERMAVNRFGDYGITLLRLHKLYPCSWRIVKYRLFSPQLRVVRTVGWVLGAGAYLLTKAAARTFVSNYSIVATGGYFSGGVLRHRHRRKPRRHRPDFLAEFDCRINRRLGSRTVVHACHCLRSPKLSTRQS
jgi:GR25 family glycosyltransferase involved in LPS biosynthesis